MKGFFRRRLDKRIEVVKKIVVPDYSVQSAGRLKSAFRSVAGLGSGLKLLFGGDRPTVPIGVIEQRWGINDKNRKQVLRRFVFELILFGGVFLYEFGYAAMLIYNQVFNLLHATELTISLMLMGFVVWRALLALWRYEVVSRRSYVPFGAWLRGR